MRLANPNPPLCSACYQQKPAMAHIDFEAAWDGPNFKDGVMGENGEVSSNIPVSIDDLVICEECLRAAVAMLPEDEATQSQLDDLLGEVKELKGEAEKREAYVEKLEAAFDAKGEREKHRAPRRART